MEKDLVKKLKTIGDLTPNKDNPRRISEEKTRMLKKSLDEFGNLSDIIFNVRTAKLCGGHQRQTVIPGNTELQNIVMLEKQNRQGTVGHGEIFVDGEKHTVRLVDWPQEKEKAANIAANKGAGEWDFPKLTEWLIELDHLNFDLELTMFSNEELENLMAPKEAEMPDLGDGQDSMIIQRTFTLTTEQSDELDEAMELAQKNEDCEDSINENKNGNILTAIARAYALSKRD